MRPYLFKLPAYRYEQEIRFVFGIHPKLAEEASGVLVELDGKTLIREVSVSDSIPRDEARLIIDLWLKVKRDELPKLVYPLNYQDIWDERLRPLRGIPFTAEDDPAELFPNRLPLTIPQPGPTSSTVLKKDTGGVIPQHPVKDAQIYHTPPKARQIHRPGMIERPHE
jgi:hypothetical protein